MGLAAGVVFVAVPRRSPEPRPAPPRTAIAAAPPAAEELPATPEETEQIHHSDVVAQEPTIKDLGTGDEHETENDLPGDSGVGGAPFEGPPNNGLIGLGGGAGGAFGSRSGGVAARNGFVNLPVMPDVDGLRFGAESYAGLDENEFLLALMAPLSTFSIDVDTASYSNVRRFLTQDSCRRRTRCASRRWSTTSATTTRSRRRRRRSRVTLEVAGARGTPSTGSCASACKGREIDRDERPPRNLVFLIDVSGSMSGQNKLPLVKEAL